MAEAPADSHSPGARQADEEETGRQAVIPYPEPEAVIHTWLELFLCACILACVVGLIAYSGRSKR
jgi:hypothetical protein